MAMGNRRPQSLTAWGAAMGARHVGFRPGLIDEDQPVGVEIDLAVKPVLPFLQDVRAVLFAGVRGLFLRVIRWRLKNRCIVPNPN